MIIKEKAYSILIALASLLCIVLSGCAELDAQDEIEKSIENSLGSVEILDCKSGETGDGNHSNIYTIKYRDITFQLENYIYQDTLFGFDTVGYSNTYTYNVYSLFKTQIDEIILKYGMSLSDMNYDRTSNIQIINTANNFSDIRDGLNCLDEISKLLSDYLSSDKSSLVNLGLTLYTDVEEERWTTSINDKTPLDIEYNANMLNLHVAQLIRDGRLENFEYSEDELNKIPIEKINKLYINNNQINSDRYDIEFTYDTLTNQYYTVVCFGTQLDYNGGVDDYFQREIIETTYPDCNYLINNDEKESTYQINGTKYRVKRKKENDIRAYKGFREIELNTVKAVNGNVPHATYYTWISLDSFAELMEMKVTDITNEAVYLETIN